MGSEWGKGGGWGNRYFIQLQFSLVIIVHDNLIQVKINPVLSLFLSFISKNIHKMADNESFSHNDNNSNIVSQVNTASNFVQSKCIL